MKRYNVVMKANQGGFNAAAMAHNVGSVISTVSAYDGVCDLAIFDVPDEAADDFEDSLDADENVIKYREVCYPSVLESAN